MNEENHTNTLVVSATCHEVLKYFEERQARRRNYILATIAISATVIVGVSGVLINELLSARVKEGVERGIRENLSYIRISGEIARLSFQLAERKEKGFSSRTAQRVIREMALLKQYTEHPAITPDERKNVQGRVTPLVELATELMVGSAQTAHVNTLESKFPNIFIQSSEITQIMLQDVARRLIGDASAPNNWFDSDNQPSELYKKYRIYADRAKGMGYPEMYLAFELIVRRMRKRPEEEILALISDASTLETRDKLNFIKIMTKFANEKFRRTSVASSRRIANQFKGFIIEYRKRNELIQSISVP